MEICFFIMLIIHFIVFIIHYYNVIFSKKVVKDLSHSPNESKISIYRRDELLIEIHHAIVNCWKDKKYIEKCKYLLNIKPTLVNKAIPPYGYTPFLRACSYGCTQLVSYMLYLGADINIRNIYGDSPFYLAIYAIVTEKNKSFDVLKTLINAGCSINLIRHNRYTALHLAACYGHEDLIRWLLINGANPNPVGCKCSPYETAIRHHHYNVATLLKIIVNDYDDEEAKLFK